MLMSDYITPLMNIDPSGEFFLAILGTLVVAAIVGAVVGGVVALINGENILAGFASGAITAVITTIDLSISLTFGGYVGLLVSSVFGFLGGYVGDIFNQGISKGWDSIDRSHAAKVGAINGAFTVLSFGIFKYIYQSSSSIFGDVINGKLSFLTRLNSSLSITAPSFYLTLTYGSIFNYFSTQIGLFIDNEDATRNTQIVIDAYAGCR